MKNTIRIGISSCLLGEQVRYDGGHKRDVFIVDTLGDYFEFVPVCPEVAIGLGVPRPAIRLVGDPDAPRAVGRDDPRLDVTSKLTAYGTRMARQMDDIYGYIFKSKSPSCGMERVPVYVERGTRNGRGLYADAFLAAQPWLPAEDEGRLSDAGLRDNFLERVFAYRRWCELAAAGINVARLTDFHAVHKLALMAHDPRAVSALGRLLASAGRGRAQAVGKEYLNEFMAVLARPATPARHENALSHLMGYLKRALNADDRAELAETILCFRAGALPRAAVLVLLRHHFRHHPDSYIARQVYLYPDAPERVVRGL